MATTYIPAPEVQEMANDLIQQYHQHLLENEVRIEYVFIDSIPKRGSKEIWGTMRKVSNLAAYLAGSDDDKAASNSDPFFVMTISKPVWDVLTLDKRRALVDHELCHAYSENDEEKGIKLKLEPHDLEEFVEIVKRYGLWREDVKTFVKAATKEKDDADGT